MMSEINWHVTDSDRKLIVKIAERTVELAKDHGIKYRKIDAVMDLTACHANGNPLRLQELLDAADSPRGDFGHDVFGIRRFIDRNTGKLTGFFSPRFTKRVEE